MLDQSKFYASSLCNVAESFVWFGMQNGVVGVVDVSSPEFSISYCQISDSHSTPVVGLAYQHVDGGHIWSASSDGQLRVWIAKPPPVMDLLGLMKIEGMLQVKTKKWEPMWCSIENSLFQWYSDQFRGPSSGTCDLKTEFIGAVYKEEKRQLTLYALSKSSSKIQKVRLRNPAQGPQQDLSRWYDALNRFTLQNTFPTRGDFFPFPVAQLDTDEGIRAICPAGNTICTLGRNSLRFWKLDSHPQSDTSVWYPYFRRVCMASLTWDPASVPPISANTACMVSPTFTNLWVASEREIHVLDILGADRPEFRGTITVLDSILMMLVVPLLNVDPSAGSRSPFFRSETDHLRERKRRGTANEQAPMPRTSTTRHFTISKVEELPPPVSSNWVSGPGISIEIWLYDARGRISIYDAATSARLRSFKVHGEPTSIAYVPIGNPLDPANGEVWIGTRAGQILRYDKYSGKRKEQSIRTSHPSQITAMVAAGNQIFSSTLSGHLARWTPEIRTP